MKSHIHQPRKHSPLELYQRNNQETPFNENHARTARDLTDQTNATKRLLWKTGSLFFAVRENVLTTLGQTDIVRRNTTPPSAKPRRSHLANRHISSQEQRYSCLHTAESYRSHESLSHRLSNHITVRHGDSHGEIRRLSVSCYFRYWCTEKLCH